MQNSIMVVVDSVAAYEQDTLENNAYVLHNTNYITGNPGNLTTPVQHVIGAAYPDGRVVQDTPVNWPVFNWLSMPVSGLPTTLPDSFYIGAAREVAKRRYLEALASAQTDDERVAALELFERTAAGVLNNMGARPQSGDTVRRPAFDLDGNTLTKAEAGASVSFYPLIMAIGGEAVTARVMHPAIYGSPSIADGGWYYSAMIDVSKPGRYSYTITITLFPSVTPTEENNIKIKTFELHSAFDVTQNVLINGFNGSLYPGVLPIAPSHEGAVK